MSGDILCALLFLYLPLTAALLAFAGFLQFLQHREWMLLVSKGLIDPRGQPRTIGSNPLRWAVVLLFTGVGIALGVWPVGLADPAVAYGLTPWMLLGAMPVSLAAGLAIIHGMGGGRATGN